MMGSFVWQYSVSYRSQKAIWHDAWFCADICNCCIHCKHHNCSVLCSLCAQQAADSTCHYLGIWCSCLVQSKLYTLCTLGCFEGDDVLLRHWILEWPSWSTCCCWTHRWYICNILCILMEKWSGGHLLRLACVVILMLWRHTDLCVLCSEIMSSFPHFPPFFPTFVHGNHLHSAFERLLCSLFGLS